MHDFSVADELGPRDHVRFLDWMILYKGVDIGHANDMTLANMLTNENDDWVYEVKDLLHEWRRWKDDVAPVNS